MNPEPDLHSVVSDLMTHLKANGLPAESAGPARILFYRKSRLPLVNLYRSLFGRWEIRVHLHVPPTPHDFVLLKNGPNTWTGPTYHSERDLYAAIDRELPRE